MGKSKKITLGLLACLCICMINMNVKAQGTGDMTYDEGAEVYIPTEEQIRHAQEKELAMLNTPVPQTEGFKTLAVTCYPQDEDYYCGPATVKQVLHFLTGENYPQSVYAEGLGTKEAGTDFSKIPNYVNGRIGSNYYVFVPIINIDNWYSKIRWDTNNGYPVFLDINTNSVADIPYNVEGHIVNVSGYNELESEVKVRITDPYQKALGNNWYAKSELYKANNAHFLQAMIW